MAGRGLMHLENQVLVQTVHAGGIARMLHSFECHCEPHGTFVTALNCLLVWTGARPATLPAWKYCSKNLIADFVNHLNAVSQQLHHPRPAEILIIERPQKYRSGEITLQRLITLNGKPGISFDPKLYVEDEQIGRELGMYPPNTRLFAEGHDLSRMAFSVWEAGLDALIYAEAWDEDLLTDGQRKEFLRRCQDTVHLWNETMRGLGLEYRFYGSMDWRRQEVPFQEAKNTLHFYGKTHLGYESRVSTLLNRPITFHPLNFAGQSAQRTHAVRG